VKSLSGNKVLDLRLALRRYSAGLLVIAAACTSATSITGINGPIPPSSPTPRQTAFLDTVERRTFNWFWEQTDANTGLTPDRWPTKSFSSVAAIGFALTADPVGVERGYVSRVDAAQRTLNTLRFMSEETGPNADLASRSFADEDLGVWSLELCGHAVSNGVLTFMCRSKIVLDY
jgi:hypothetical protein